MTLVRRLRKVSGGDPPYVWRVEVWRADTAAHANLRVRLKVRAARRRWLTRLHGRVSVYHTGYQQTESASTDTVEETVAELREKGEHLAQRFAEEDGAVAEMDLEADDGG